MIVISQKQWEQLGRKTRDKYDFSGKNQEKFNSLEKDSRKKNILGLFNHKRYDRGEGGFP